MIAPKQTTIPLDEARTGLHVCDLVYGDQPVDCEPDRVKHARGASNAVCT
jgi:hypothetical protein